MSELTISVDTPDSYKPPARSGEAKPMTAGGIEAALAHDNFNPQLLATEEARLGVSFADNPEGFIASHNQLVEGFGKKLDELYPATLEHTIDAVAAHLAKGDEARYQDLRSTFHERVSHFQGVVVLDHFASAQPAHFRPFSRNIMVNSLFGLLAEAEGDRLLTTVILPHEAIHSFMTGARTEDAMDNGLVTMDLPSRTGIETRHVVSDKPVDDLKKTELLATWVSEVYTEDLRAQVLGTEEVGYSRGVAFLRTLKDLDPELEEALDRTAFEKQGPGVLIGRIENLIGPLGVEAVSELLRREWDSDQNAFVYAQDQASFITNIVSLVDPDRQEAARSLLTAHLKEIRPIPLPPELESGH